MKIEIYGDSLVELKAVQLAVNYLVDNYVASSVLPDNPPDYLPDNLPVEGQASMSACTAASVVPLPPATVTVAPVPVPPEAVAQITDPPVPVAPAPTPETGSNGIIRDTTGCPWDERIHSGGKTQTKAGKWVRRKNIADDAYRAVMHEITDPNFDPSVPYVEVPEVPEVPDPATAGFGANGNGDSAALAWPDVVQAVMTAKVSEQLSDEQLQKSVAELGVEGGFNAMASHPELYPQLMIKLSL